MSLISSRISFVISLRFQIMLTNWNLLRLWSKILNITSVSVFWRPRFCDWEEKWQLLHVPGETSINRQHTPVQLLVADIPHPCLLSLKTDRKQRKRGESLFDCRQAPEAATEHCLANENKLIHKVLTALRAAVFMKKKTQNKWHKRSELLLYNVCESFSLVFLTPVVLSPCDFGTVHS